MAADREDLRENECVKESEESDQRLLLLQICSRGVVKVVELLDITNISLSYIYLMENYYNYFDGLRFSSAISPTGLNLIF